MEALSQTNVVDFSAALAADLAAELYDQETVFANHGISLAEGEFLLSQPWFKTMVDTAKRDWEGIGNVKDRIRIKAQITLEEALPTIYALIADHNTPGAARVAAFKELKEVAGMGARESDGGGASYVPIQIFLDGRENPPVTVEAAVPLGNKNNELEDISEVEDAVEVEEIKDKVKKAKEQDLDGFYLGMGEF